MAAGVANNSTIIILENTNNGTDLKDDQAVRHMNLLSYHWRDQLSWPSHKPSTLTMALLTRILK